MEHPAVDHHLWIEVTEYIVAVVGVILIAWLLAQGAHTAIGWGRGRRRWLLARKFNELQSGRKLLTRRLALKENLI